MLARPGRERPGTVLILDRPARNYTALHPMTHVDPVCGMTIDEEDAVGTYAHNGVTYYFCADSCLERFKQAPDSFIAGTAPDLTPAAAPLGARVEYTCPMDPQIIRDAPGACPIGRMHGVVPTYFDTAVVITALVLLGQVLELRARHRTGAAIRQLLGLAPKTARIVREGGDRDVPLEHVQVGDLCRVRPGEKVPVD